MLQTNSVETENEVNLNLKFFACVQVHEPELSPTVPSLMLVQFVSLASQQRTAFMLTN